MDRSRTLPRRAAMIGAAGGAAAFLALRACAARAEAGPLFVVCRVHPATGAGIALVDEHAAAVPGPSLPARGHGICLRPGTAEAVVFARRPGTFAAVFEPATGLVVRRFDTPPERHFYGHGVFEPDRPRAGGDRERHQPRAGRAGPVRCGRRLPAHRRAARPRHRSARHRAAAGRQDAGRRQWRHPDPAGKWARQAQPRQHAAEPEPDRARLRPPPGRRAAARPPASPVDPSSGAGRGRADRRGPAMGRRARRPRAAGGDRPRRMASRRSTRRRTFLRRWRPISAASPSTAPARSSGRAARAATASPSGAWPTAGSCARSRSRTPVRWALPMRPAGSSPRAAPVR